MSLTHRSLLLALLIVLMAVVGLWGSDAALQKLWLIPAAMLLLGLAVEGLLQRRLRIEAAMTAPVRAHLGRAVDLVLAWRSTRAATLRFMAAAPAGIDVP